MKKTGSGDQALAWSLPLIGKLVCSSFGIRKQNDLVRMTVNSLVWPGLGVLEVTFAK
jgi:hypothetical protein